MRVDTRFGVCPSLLFSHRNHIVADYVVLVVLSRLKREEDEGSLSIVIQLQTVVAYGRMLACVLLPSCELPSCCRRFTCPV